MPERSITQQVQYGLYRMQRFVGLKYRDEIDALKGKIEAQGAELAQRQLRIDRAARSIDYLFDLQFSTVIRHEILTRAGMVKKPDYRGAQYTKNFKTIFNPYKVGTAYQLFCLELDCMARINEVISATGKRRHFPVLIDFDLEALTITCSDEGVCVSDLTAPVIVPDVEEQLDAIVETLDAARVIHLDMHRNGKNLLVSSDGTLTLIDFDIARAGEVAFNWNIEMLLDRPKRRVTKETMLTALEVCEFIEI